MRLTRKGLLGLEYQAIDQKKVKTQSWYEVDLVQLEGVEISTRAKKKLELRDYLLSHPESASLASLLESYSREQVNFFVEQGAVTIVQKEVQRSAAYFEGIEASQPLELNPEQRQARDAVVSAIGSHQLLSSFKGLQEVGRRRFICRLSKEPWTRARQLFCWCLRFP